MATHVITEVYSICRQTILGVVVRPDSGVGDMVFVLTTSVAVLVLVERLLNSSCDRYHYRQGSLSPKR
jgi:hypothetical protein